jgi:Family of unknown function (DUF6491)
MTAEEDHRSAFGSIAHMKFGIAAAIVFAMTTLALPAGSQPTEQAHTRCFFISQFDGWKAPDSRTIYIRAFPRHYYRLDLVGRCSQLTSPGAFLITKFRGSPTVCSALDWDIHVATSHHDIPQPCIVRRMTELTAAEAAAIPKRYRP